MRVRVSGLCFISLHYLRGACSRIKGTCELHLVVAWVVPGGFNVASRWGCVQGHAKFRGQQCLPHSRHREQCVSTLCRTTSGRTGQSAVPVTSHAISMHMDCLTQEHPGPGTGRGALRLDLDDQGPWNHAACALTGTIGMMLPVHCAHIIQPMLCALSCGNSIALFCHAQLGISRCDGPAVCRTSLFLSLLSAPVATGRHTGSSSSSCTCLDCLI